MRERARMLAVAMAVVLSAGNASAQEAPPRDLSRVFVQVADQGEEMAGHLLDLGPSGVTLLIDGIRREVPLEAVLRVQTRGDSLWNGAAIGAAVGAVVFALLASEYGDAAVPGALLGTALYASIGASVDALIPGRTTLYRKAPRDTPHSGGPSAAIAMKIRF
jgi:hypothetical protein